MGMVNYVGKFSPSLPALTKPLRDLLKSDSTWTWDAQQKTAFEKIKKELSSPPVLAQYSPKKETMVSADASSYGLGAVLLQRQTDGRWRPVVYISRSLTPTEVQYAQIEKEALAATWACERLSSYLLGLEFTVRTDHKPLISLLGSRSLDDLPPRILRFRLRLLRFNYKIIHVPGKQLVTADTLSRAPLGMEDREANSSLQKECCAYIDHILHHLPATDSKLVRIKEAQSTDCVCRQLKTLTEKGWPSHRRSVPEHLLPFWAERNNINMAEGLLLKGTRILIPGCMQQEMMERLHEGHQGVTKCVARAQGSLWWPGITRQIKEMVERCEICCQYSQTKTEPLMTTPLPARPWQKVAADIFQWKNGHYIVVVDYYSRYIEVANLPTLTTSTTVERLKVIFARFGVPEILVTDNGPQFASTDFATFAQNYGFNHTTSSPRYPQSNGEAERAVRTVKQLLNKSPDPQKALLAYRATPLAHGLSPAQLLMGRRIRSTVPTTPQALKPAWPNLRAFEEKDKELKVKQRKSFNLRHRTKDLPVLVQGQRVWIRTAQTTATVQGPASTPRSYTVETDQGSLRRNRAHLTVLPERSLSCSDETETVPRQTDSGETVTRSGRVSRPPDRLDL